MVSYSFFPFFKKKKNLDQSEVQITGYAVNVLYATLYQPSNAVFVKIAENCRHRRLRQVQT